jgi:hypothetical protein
LLLFWRTAVAASSAWWQGAEQLVQSSLCYAPTRFCRLPRLFSHLSWHVRVAKHAYSNAAG